MSSVLRGGYVDVEVHLVDEVASIDASSARSSASEIPASSPPATNVVEVGTLAPSPEIPPGPPGEYLRTGVRVRRGFASGRVVTRARTRFGAAVRRGVGGAAAASCGTCCISRRRASSASSSASTPRI